MNIKELFWRGFWMAFGAAVLFTILGLAYLLLTAMIASNQ